VRYTVQRYGGSAGVSVEGMTVDGEAAGRLTVDLRQMLLDGRVTMRLKGGVAAGAAVVPQMGLWAGGVNTVRGYDFGAASGDLLWAAQVDLMRRGRGAVKTVLFADAGQAGSRSAFGDAPLLAGAGAGLSVLGGLIRAELSHPLTERNGRGVRFDLVFGGIR
jgi:hemolysin activation/secretion protein